MAWDAIGAVDDTGRDGGGEPILERSFGRTEAYLECLELLRSVWVHLPRTGEFDRLDREERLAACQEALGGARAEMLARMSELRDRIERETHLRRGATMAPDAIA